MRSVSLLAGMAALALPTVAGASPRFLPQPPPTPLGVPVRESRSIHVLKVESVGFKGVSFKAMASLKGKPAQAPFRFLRLMEDVKCEDSFRAGTLVLCFHQGAVAILHVSGHWALAVEPISWRGEKEWFCLAEDKYAVIYEGSTEALRSHVAVIQAGRATTITARAPKVWGSRDNNRIWRIKAALGITTFVLSGESPHFVGWGTGDPAEVTKLVQALGTATPRYGGKRGGSASLYELIQVFCAPTSQHRITAAADLAHLGPAARPALPALRRAVRDPDSAIAMAAAQALARLVPDDGKAIEAIETRLRVGSASGRAAAAEALGNLGPEARPALPALLRALRDKDKYVRAAGARAIGQIAPGSGHTGEAVAALGNWLKGEKEEYPRHIGTQALLRFGPHAWAALPELYATGLFREERAGPWGRDEQVLDLLTRFDPPPVELLATVLADTRSHFRDLVAASRRLAVLGPRARAALPALHAVVHEVGDFEKRNWESLALAAGEAILAIDPEGGPVVAVPALVTVAKGSSPQRGWAAGLLGRCGAAARPLAPGLVASLDIENFDTPNMVRHLAPLLGPKDRPLLPTLRRQLSGKWGPPLALAKVLLRLGCREEALAEAAGRLVSDYPPHRVRSAHWLGDHGRGVQAVERALERALETATGAERARLVLSLCRVRGEKGTRVQVRARAALDALLALCEGEAPAVGEIDQFAFWSWELGRMASQENDAVGAAVGVVQDRLAAGSESVTLLLDAMLRDKNPRVRLAAAVTLACVEPRHPGTVRALGQLLARYPYYFPFVADTLAALGPAAAPLAPQLLPLLRYPDSSVCQAASVVLYRIDPDLAAKGWGAAGVPGAVPADIDPLWQDLAGRDPFRADLAIWRLAGAGKRTVTLLREQLRPPPVLTAARTARLIADLDSDNFTTRQRAQTELAAAIESAAPSLWKARTNKPSLEVRRRIAVLLQGLEPMRSPEQRRRLRGVRLLAEMDTPDARALLARLARGDSRQALTREAAAALRRPGRP